MKTVVRGGTVVSAVDTVAADVLVDGERIVALAAPTATWPHPSPPTPR
ncbi:MAG: hypothetical protein R2755_19240 [Acidimicrobiales bacterium]